MADPREIEVAPRSAARLARSIGPERAAALQAAAESGRRKLDGRRLWHVNSTAAGGGVAEMLRLLVGYAMDVGVDTRWVVLDGDVDFFTTTKRIHNRLHGAPGDTGALGRREADHYDAILDANADALERKIQRDDIVILHDPQTAGLVGRLVQRGVRVVWRCHIGTEVPNEHSKEAWDLLLPRLADCHTFVFSHAAFVPPELRQRDVWIIEPSIDPLSPKNRRLPPSRRADLLTRIGLIPGETTGTPRAVLAGAGPFSTHDRLVVQVSRWDRLKDMLGVLHGFAEHVVGHEDARLALVGPAVDGVTDDLEGTQVLEECLAAWDALPGAARDAVRLVALPMADVTTNALMVNAVQHHASVVVQKSIREGFGLTVAEAMWKSRPVIGSAVGGIVNQIPAGTGVLIDDPLDLALFGRTLRELLGDPERRMHMGRRARQHIRVHFLSDRHLIDYAHLVEHMSST
ncbi:MAG TPA: glycosyltransferase [Acidimicrobiales bacterium]|nr:glycosyltransferase [Acidimicrobiales bacterium]